MLSNEIQQNVKNALTFSKMLIIISVNQQNVKSEVKNSEDQQSETCHRDGAAGYNTASACGAVRRVQGNDQRHSERAVMLQQISR